LVQYSKERREQEGIMKKQAAVIWELKEKFDQQDLRKCLQKNNEALKAYSDAGAALA
jgi:hypothetical protein